jgi:membrane-associated phospholipid phosphatase/uncharacterized damage-inducible protein DinB
VGEYELRGRGSDLSLSASGWSWLTRRWDRGDGPEAPPRSRPLVGSATGALHEYRALAVALIDDGELLALSESERLARPLPRRARSAEPRAGRGACRIPRESVLAMDSAILTWIHGHSSPTLDAVFRFSNELGTLPFCASLVVLMILWHVARKERREALAWLVVGLATAGAVELLKASVGRPRPTLWPHLVAVSGASFPSGHATAGAALFPLLGWIALRARPRGRRVGWALGLAVGVFVGVGRLYLGVHWPSDVLAGWALGVALGAGAVVRLRPPTRPEERRAAGTRPARRDKEPDRGDTMTDDVRRALVRELEGFAREIELFPDDASIWKTLPGVSNSAGNLALHVCGNLKHFVGAVLGRTGYVRARDQEFAIRAGTRADVVREIRDTIEVVASVLPRVPASALDAPFPESHGDVQLPAGRFLLHLCTHAAHHLGQAGYLRRILTGKDQASGALSIRALADG